MQSLFLILITSLLSFPAPPHNSLTPQAPQIIVTSPQTPNTSSLKILSWNIYMLPTKTFMFTGQTKRATVIVDSLKNSDYDVIIFQEAFHKKALQILSTGLQESFPYQIGPANKGGWLKTSSGLWVVSKYPMKKLDAIQFKACKGVDCMSKKGALLVEVEKNKQRFQIMNTHLQAAGQKDNNRIKQFNQLFDDLLAHHSEDGVPQILCGDYNIPHTTPTYKKLLKKLKAKNGPLEGRWKKTSSTPEFGGQKKYIDFILYRKNNKETRQIKRQIKRVTGHWIWKKKKRKDLSDHFAVEAILTW